MLCGLYGEMAYGCWQRKHTKNPCIPAEGWVPREQGLGCLTEKLSRADCARNIIMNEPAWWWEESWSGKSVCVCALMHAACCGKLGWDGEKSNKMERFGRDGGGIFVTHSGTNVMGPVLRGELPGQLKEVSRAE
jgi:hypothetical protein